MAIILTAYPSSLEVTRGEHIVEGTINANDVQFVLPKGDTAWKGVTLVACFRSLLCERSVVLDFETLRCKFPWEVNAKGSAGSPVSIGLYGAGDPKGKTVVRSTVWVDLPFGILASAGESAETPNPPPEEDMESAKEPTPTQYQQMLVAVSGIVQRMDNLVEAEEAADRAASSEQAAQSAAEEAKASALSAQTSAEQVLNAYEDAMAAADRVEKAAEEWEDSIQESRFVTDTTTVFALSDSPVQAPTDDWSEMAPQWREGKYLWQKVIVTYSDGTMRTHSTTCLSGAQGQPGVDATTLLIDSSRGTVFKNSKINTTLTVTVYKGNKAIHTLEDLKKEYGSGAYLEWSWRRQTDASFGVLLVTDSRISDDGFTFTISPGEVDRKVVLKCQLIT